MEPFDGTSDGERLFGAALEQLRSTHDAVGLARALSVFTALAEELAETVDAPVLACRAGCPYCCVLNVTVLLPEAAAIAARLALSLTATEYADFTARLDGQRMRVRWMEDGERVRRQYGCPFLNGVGSCSIHPFRPLMCRGITSIDSILCREALDPTELDVPGAVPMDLARKTIMDEAFLALARAVADCGMEARGIELSAGVGAFLARPGLSEKLLAGERLPDWLWE